MRLLICGGRHFAERAWFDREMEHVQASYAPATVIITGCAGGADAMARSWAHDHGVPLAVFKADWTAHGRAAGPKRNQQMLDDGKPEVAMFFPGGKGTADMMRRVLDVRPPVRGWIASR